ncbi:MAG: hypothetical protein UX38_C0009G0002 [Microgenomates group bacterium GW2011_GWC1_46_16]|nr:MAG: hypothetical protein UX38_C0009G0002 [Microgenomates group bacterium GW2011_GWC1_46_16]
MVAGKEGGKPGGASEGGRIGASGPEADGPELTVRVKPGRVVVLPVASDAEI